MINKNLKKKKKKKKKKNPYHLVKYIKKVIIIISNTIIYINFVLLHNDMLEISNILNSMFLIL